MPSDGAHDMHILFFMLCEVGEDSRTKRPKEKVGAGACEWCGTVLNCCID